MITDALTWFLFLLLLTIVPAAIWWGRKQQSAINEAHTKIELMRENREKFYAALADPTAIEEDFEKGAQRREMFDAKRTTLPREDAGPPAKVYRPSLRAKPPNPWSRRSPDWPSNRPNGN